MNQNKEAARVLEHPNGKRREIAQPRVSIVHHPRRDFKRQAAKLVLTVCGLVFLTSIVGIAEGVGIPRRLLHGRLRADRQPRRRCSAGGQ